MPEANPPSAAVGAVVLAAGRGHRFGEPAKLRVPFRGRPLVRWAVDAALAARIGPVTVVVGGVDLSDVLPPGVDVLENPAAGEGLATSLAVALDRAAGLGLTAVVVGLGDQPLVPASAWRAVATETATPVVMARYGGERAHPVRLAREVWGLLPSRGEEGARRLVRERPELVTLVPCSGHPADIDTPEDLDRWS